MDFKNESVKIFALLLHHAIHKNQSSGWQISWKFKKEGKEGRKKRGKKANFKKLIYENIFIGLRVGIFSYTGHKSH